MITLNLNHLPCFLHDRCESKHSGNSTLKQENTGSICSRLCSSLMSICRQHRNLLPVKYTKTSLKYFIFCCIDFSKYENKSELCCTVRLQNVAMRPLPCMLACAPLFSIHPNYRLPPSFTLAPLACFTNASFARERYETIPEILAAP
jgi:hypothetical protein